jgi:hypothetical protein
MGMSNCCVPSVPADGDFEMLARAVANWATRPPAGSDRSIQATDQTPGHWKERILLQSWRLGRTLLEEAAQTKAGQHLDFYRASQHLWVVAYPEMIR